MSIFPAMIPSTRSYSPGEYPNTAHPLMSGSEIRVRHSNTVLGVRLRLTFTAITSAELVAVRNHYQDQRGGFLPFAIPEELLSGVATPADFTPAGHQWRYAARPSVSDVPIPGTTPTNRHDLVLELESVPPENTIVSGARLRAQVLLQTGSAQRGAFFDVIASVVGGAAGYLLEANLYATVELVRGEAGVGGGEVAITAEASLAAGAASAGVGGSIDVGAITYSQSSVYPGNSAATNAGMTNGITAETLETGTNFGNQWVKMDLGDVYSVATVYVGADFTRTLAGGWGAAYLENLNMQYSQDGGTWTTFVNIGTFSTALKTFSVSFNARYIRIVNPSGYIAVTEFYATST